MITLERSDDGRKMIATCLMLHADGKPELVMISRDLPIDAREAKLMMINFARTARVRMQIEAIGKGINPVRAVGFIGNVMESPIRTKPA